jgi:predicted ester cyclase
MTIPEQRATSPLEAVHGYLAAWNAHHGAEVARIVTGTYIDPTLPAPIHGDDLAANVEGLCRAFPDLRFVSEGELADGDTVVARWRMQGTNNGEPLAGAPAATNGTIDLPGVDVITTRDGEVVDVVGYFDQKLFVEQLGLQAVVMPGDEWPVSFGLATRVDLGNTTVPGAVSFTWIDTDDTAELQRRTTEIVTALASEPAFIGFRAMSIGGRNVTLTLWTSPEAAEAALARNAPHNAAMDRLWQHGLGTRGFTSIWQPFRVNNQFAGCSACARYVAIVPGEQSATCECGGTVEVTSYL